MLAHIPTKEQEGCTILSGIAQQRRPAYGFRALVSWDDEVLQKCKTRLATAWLKPMLPRPPHVSCVSWVKLHCIVAKDTHTALSMHRLLLQQTNACNA